MIRFLSALIAICIAGLAFASGPTTTAVNSPASTVANLTASAVNLSATGDAATIAIPAWVTTYQITGIKIYNCSTSPILASLSVWTGAGGTGTNIVAAATITGASSPSVVLASSLATTNSLTAGTIFVRVGVANVAALTCNIHLVIDDLS